MLHSSVLPEMPNKSDERLLHDILGFSPILQLLGHEIKQRAMVAGNQKLESLLLPHCRALR
ncbi:hypothetical protein D3C79_1072740 [compost metagenome]